jgi:hypothetical protein
MASARTVPTRNCQFVLVFSSDPDSDRRVDHVVLVDLNLLVILSIFLGGLASLRA